MRPGTKIMLVVAAALAGGGCRALDTFNPYDRISVVDFAVAPQVAGRVIPDSLLMLKESSMRWLLSTGKFMEVADGNAGGPETLFVEGTVCRYRPHSTGRKIATMFTGIDMRGESYIQYRFYDSMGRTILQTAIQARFLEPAQCGDPTAEAAGYDLARLVSWHKNPYPAPR